MLTNVDGAGGWSEIELNSASGYAIPGNVLFESNGSNNTTNLWLGLQNGEENGGQAQINPAAVVTFSTLTEGSNLILNRFSRPSGAHPDDRGPGGRKHEYAQVNQVENYSTSGSPGRLILNTPDGATYLYRGQILDNGGSLTLEKTGLGTQIIEGGDLTYTGGTVVAPERSNSGRTSLAPFCPLRTTRLPAGP